jgi:hypothetical protein
MGNRLTGYGKRIGSLWLGNGGQIVLQTDTYQHSYTSEEQAANDIGDLISSGGETGEWEGNEEERIDLKGDGMGSYGNSIVAIFLNDSMEGLAAVIDDAGGNAAHKLAQMLAPSYY